MEYRYLGHSGLKISEITYGNWLTHGSQVENDIATQCVQAALDAGISTFDTADVYANTAAETVLGEALKGERRESLEIFTKVYWPTGPKGKNDTGLSRKHIMESINGSLQRLQTDYVDLYQAHRFDTETPLEETMQAFADIVRQGKALYIGVSEWTADQIRAGVEMSRELGFQLISSQPQYSMLWRVIEDEVVPACEELGVSQIVWSPIAQGVLTGKYVPGQPLPEGSRATDEKGGADMIKRFMNDDVLARVQALKPVADEAGLTMAQLAVAWVLQNDNVASAIVGASRPEQVGENVKAAGVRLDADAMKAIDDALGDVVVRDPAMTLANSPRTRAWSEGRTPLRPRRRSGRSSRLRRRAVSPRRRPRGGRRGARPGRRPRRAVATPARASRRALRRSPRRWRIQAAVNSPSVRSIDAACATVTRVAAPVVVPRSWAPVSAAGSAVMQPVASRASTAAACFSPSTRSSRTAIDHAPSGSCTRTGWTRCPNHPPPSRSSSVGEAENVSRLKERE